ncbi:MAG: methylenetetrahydrofolate reductase [Candidatus Dormibacteria bacterium]
MTPTGLETKLARGGFAVTAELTPPRSASADAVREKVRALAGHVDAVNVTDNTAANVAMSAIAAAVVALAEGLEPVVQLTGRDRNRMALQSDLLGLAALGLCNVMLLTGDPPATGRQPETKGVYDLDTVTVIGMARDMRDRGLFMNGEEIRGQWPHLYIGAALNPFLAPQRELERFAAKVEAGCDFVQTQFVYDLEAFRAFMEAASGLGLPGRVRILAGIGPLRSADQARRLAAEVPGVTIPAALVDRLERAADPREEGLLVAQEIVEAVRLVPGVSGVHLMAMGWEESIPELVRRAQLPVGAA